jgi:hypothetical protein
MFRNLPNLMSTLVVERETLRQLGSFKAHLEILEDWELAIRLSRFANLQSIEETAFDVSRAPWKSQRDMRSYKTGFLVLGE